MISKSLGVSLKKYKINPIIRILILSDFVYWSANNLIVPIFAIWILDRVVGGSIEAVGIAASLFLLTRSLTEIPVGMIVDKIRGNRDDLYFVIIGTLMQGVIYISFAFVENVPQMYIAQIFLGMSSAISSPAWASLFTKYIDKKEEAFEWSIYDVLISVGMAATASIGAYFADKYGFDLLFILVGGITILSGLSCLIIRKYLNPKIQ